MNQPKSTRPEWDCQNGSHRIACNARCQVKTTCDTCRFGGCRSHQVKGGMSVTAPQWGRADTNRSGRMGPRGPAHRPDLRRRLFVEFWNPPYARTDLPIRPELLEPYRNGVWLAPQRHPKPATSALRVDDSKPATSALRVPGWNRKNLLVTACHGHPVSFIGINRPISPTKTGRF